MKTSISIKHEGVLIWIVLSVFIFSGCSSFGTRTLFKSENFDSYNIKQLGYSQPVSENLLNKIKPNSSKLFQLSIENYFTNKPIMIKKYNLSKFELFDEIDTTEISKICKENSLDGYLCTQIKYKFGDYYYSFAFLGQSEDTYIEIKLYDSTGKLILHTKHNTAMGNSYMMPPKAEQTIKDGVFGNLKQILKELNKIKKHSSR